MRTLYDVLVSHDMSLDVYDEVYDSGVCWDMDMPDDAPREVVFGNGALWGVPDEDEERDHFDIVVETMAKSIEAGKDYGAVATAFIATYVKENLDMWRRFAQEFNGDEYLIEGDDEDSVYNGVLTIESLVIGNYCEEAYDWLVRELPAPKETD